MKGGMVDISGKPTVLRTASAEGTLTLTSKAIEAIRKGKVRKGDTFEVARVAAINAVKNTPQTIPHCHPVPVEGVEVDLKLLKKGVKAKCKVKARYKTGVEMEALAGVVAALLTVWDMVKYLEKDGKGQYPVTRISDVRVVEKRKGRGVKG